MSEHHKLTSLTGVLETLYRRGYRHDFRIKTNGLMEDFTDHKTYRPGEVRIINYYRFEGESDPADMSICYVVECADGRKGTLVDAFGTYSSRRMSRFLQDVDQVRKNTDVN